MNHGRIKNLNLPKLTNRDIKYYRLLSLITIGVIVLFSFIWSLVEAYSVLLLPIALTSTIYYISLYFLSFKVAVIKRRLNAFLYGSFLFITLFIIILAYSQGFSNEHSILVLLVIFYTMLTFDNMKRLVYYLLFSAASISILFFHTLMEQSNANNLIPLASLLIIMGIAIFNQLMRLYYQNELIDHQKDFEKLLDASSDGIYVIEDMKIVYANQAMKKLLNIDLNEEIVGRDLMEFFAMNEHERIRVQMAMLKDSESQRSFETKITLSNGVGINVEVSTSITTYRGKGVVLAIFRNIDDRKQMAKLITEAEQKYRSLVEESLVGVYIAQNNQLTYVNPYFESLFGYTREELLTMELKKIIHPDDFYIVTQVVEDIKKGLKVSPKEVRGFRKKGDLIHVQFQFSQRSSNGNSELMGTLIDITDRVQSVAKIKHMAYHDALTNLPNRNYLKNHLNTLIHEGIEEKKRISVLLIDLDRFKFVNDTMGHNIGDELLKEVALRFKSCIGKGNIVARYGGDEFVIILKDLTRGETEEKTKELIERMSEPYVIDDQTIHISPSIGISTYPKDHDQADMLIKYADTAMYLSKEQGRNTYNFFNKELNDKVSRKMRLEVDLRKAIENREFELYYQPQNNLLTGKVESCEGVIRWHHPTYGKIYPAEFIAFARDTGLLLPIGKWVLRAACQQLQLWKNSNIDLPIGINIAVEQLSDPQFKEQLKEYIHTLKLNPSHLILQISESQLEDDEEIYEHLKAIHAIGVKIAIIDFGMGARAVHTLLKSPIDSIRIDQTIVQSIDQDERAQIIIQSIVDMGKKLNLTVSTIGIENEEQLKRLTPMGITLGQGFYYCHPIPLIMFEDYLSNL